MHSNMIFGQLIWNQFRLPQIQGLDVKKHKGLRDIPICLLLLLQNFLDTIFNPSVMDTRKTFVSLSRLRDNPSVYSISSLFASLRERDQFKLSRSSLKTSQKKKCKDMANSDF